MFKRLLLTGFLCMSLVGLFTTQAIAYPAGFGGWGVKTCCSITVWSDWFGIGNYLKKPTKVKVTIELVEVQVHYLNPGGQSGGLGEPFYPDVTLTETSQLNNPSLIQKNGRYMSSIDFYDADMLAAIPLSAIPPAPNPNWSLDPNGPIVVLQVHVEIRGYSDLDGNGTVDTETAYGAGLCTLNSDHTAYSCTVEAQCGNSKFGSWPSCDLNPQAF